MDTDYKVDNRDAENQIALKVAAGSPPKGVAGAIVKNMNEGKEVTLLAMGAGAVNQAVKAVCLARGMVAVHGQNLYVIPGMVDTFSNDEQKTAISLLVKRGR